jgi:hypothetical protein
MKFVNERLAIADADKSKFISPEEFKKELDNIIG